MHIYEKNAYNMTITLHFNTSLKGLQVMISPSAKLHVRYKTFCKKIIKYKVQEYIPGNNPVAKRTDPFTVKSNK